MINELKDYSIYIEISDRCNLNCNYCYNYSHNQKNDISDIVQKRTIDLLSVHKPNKIILTGGEPLIRKDKVKEFVKELTPKNIPIHLNTNFLLFENKDWEILKECKNLISYNNLNYKQISVLKNLSNNINISINYILTNLNYKNIRNVGQKFLNSSIKYFCATPIIPSSHKQLDLVLNTSEISEVFEELNNLEKEGLNTDILRVLPICMIKNNNYEKLLKRNCTAGKSSFAITPRGNIKPCTHINEIIGSIYEDLTEIIIKLKNYHKKLIPIKCKNCSLNEICVGSCRSEAKTHFGNLYDINPYFYHILDKSMKSNLNLIEKREFALCDCI